MLELLTLAEQNPATAGLIVGGAVFLIGTTWAIVYGLRNPDTEYIAEIELGALSRTVFLVVCSTIIGGLSFQGWRNIGLIILALMIIGAIWALVRWCQEYREEKRSEHAWRKASS